MKKWSLAALALVVLAFIAIGYAITITSAPPEPQPYRRIAPGEEISLPLDKRTGPTEAAPPLTYHVRFVDQYSQKPVRVGQVWVGGKQLAVNLVEGTFQVPGDTRAAPFLLRIEADGYEPWGMELRHKINSSRHIYYEFALKPKVL